MVVATSGVAVAGDFPNFCVISLSSKIILGLSHLAEGILVGIGTGNTNIVSNLLTNIHPKEGIRSLLFSNLTGHRGLIPRPHFHDLICPSNELLVPRLHAQGKFGIAACVFMRAVMEMPYNVKKRGVRFKQNPGYYTETDQRPSSGRKRTNSPIHVRLVGQIAQIL